MELRRMEEFLTIAKCGSIKQAAQELNLSCAALSARLIRFEEQIGAPLFLRTGAGMELTVSGQQLLPNAAEISTLAKMIGQNMLAAQTYYDQRLRIAVSGPNLPLFLGPFLDQLNLSYPTIHLELLDDSAYGIEDGIRSGKVDIYFAPVMEDFRPKGLAQYTVTAANQYVILPRSHRLSERNMLSLQELDGETFLLYPKTAEPAIRDFQRRNLEDAGIRCTLYDSATAPIFFKEALIKAGKMAANN